MRTSKPLPFEPGNCLGWFRAYDTSELILPRNLRPSANGTSTMSRGIEIIETVLDTGSSETTIIVSVRYVFRPTPGVDADDQAGHPGHGRAGRRGRRGERRPARQRRRGVQVLGIRFGAERRHDGGRSGVLEDLVGGLADRLGRVAAVGLRDDDDEQDERDRQHVPAAGSRQRRVVQARPDGEEAPHQEDALQGEQRPDDIRIDELRDESWARCREDDPQHGQRARRWWAPGTARPGGAARRRGGRARGSARRGRPGCSAIGVGAAWRSPDRCRAHVDGHARIRPLFIHGREGTRATGARWPRPVHGPGERRRVSSDRFPLASGQAVRRLTLDQEIEGSNPSSPANRSTHETAPDGRSEGRSVWPVPHAVPLTRPSPSCAGQDAVHPVGRPLEGRRRQVSVDIGGRAIVEWPSVRADDDQLLAVLEHQRRVAWRRSWNGCRGRPASASRA